MNNSEQKRVNAIIKNLETVQQVQPKWRMVFGQKSFTAKQLIKELGNNKTTRQMLFEMLDNLEIKRLMEDAARRTPI